LKEVTFEDAKDSENGPQMSERERADIDPGEFSGRIEEEIQETDREFHSVLSAEYAPYTSDSDITISRMVSK